MYATKEHNPEKFQIIEIVCNNKDALKHLATKFHGEQEILQNKIISFLKFVWEQFGNEYQISTKTECLSSDSRIIPNDCPVYVKNEIKWWVWKLIYTID
ncbi:unnamed protein product [Didymodactylos carnosus]|uniref:Uncharacterized protein n=1 Tax=Didymodactylos carnosus TaxID=1234261 RepID=A0A814PHE9_9BILA|nr:unnamed protein product [Didymodactylos carnosus]CAF3870892.1 unnamed protein product [Didymodactylos carnosus]